MKIVVLISCLLFSSLSFASFCAWNDAKSPIVDVCIYGYGNSATGYEAYHGVRLDLSVGTSDLDYKFDTSHGTVTRFDDQGGEAKVVAESNHGHPLTIVFQEQGILGRTYPTSFSITDGHQVIFRSRKIEFNDAEMAVDSIIASIVRDHGAILGK